MVKNLHLLVRYTSLSLLLCFSYTLQAQIESLESDVSLIDNMTIPQDPAVRIGKLENGMHYYIRQNAKPENRAELRLAVKAGSILEDEDQLGIAHFVEHMAFNGSENFSKNELVDYLESVGTRFGPDLNAYTSFDETVYMLQVRTDDQEQFDKGILVLRDWAGGINFDDEEIDKERGVVISEWRTRLSADQRMQQEYFPVMYHNSRYAERLPIGDPELIENAPYDVFKRFYRDWYRPDLMAVIVVGDIDVDTIEKQLVDQFKDLTNPSDPRPRKEYTVPRHEETLVSICSDPEATFTNVRVMYKHKSKKVRTLEDLRESLLRSLYNRMLNSRLSEVNRQADPPFVFAYSGYGGNVGDLDTYTSYSMVPEGKALRAFETLLTENKRALDHGFNASELDRQKLEMMTSAEKSVKEKDKTESRRLIGSYIYHFLDEGMMMSPEQRLGVYEKYFPTITVEEINAVSKKWITDNNRVIVVTGPAKEDVPLPEEVGLLDILAKVDKLETEPWEDEVSDAPLLEADLAQKRIVEEVEMEELGITDFTLENGVRVMCKPTDFKNDEILLTAYSWGGHSQYTYEEYLSAKAISSIVRESGVGDFDAPQLEKKLAGKTVFVSPFVGERIEGFNGSCSPDDLETLMQLIYLYFQPPRKDEVAMSAYLKKQESIYKNLLSNPGNYFRDRVIKIKTQNHERRGIPDVEQLEKIDHDKVLELYADRFADASDFVFFFVGAFELDHLKAMAATYLGNLPSIDREESWKDIGVRYPEGKVDETFKRGAAPKSNVEINFNGPFEWDHWNRYVLRSTIDLLRIKLRESLREDKGGVYGVRIYGTPAKEPLEEYSITISFNSDPPRTEELIDAAYEVIDEIKNNGVEEKDLEKVKETQLQGHIKNLKQNRYWRSNMAGSWMRGTDISNITLERQQALMEKLQAGDIQKAVSQYFNTEQMIQVVMHPEETEN